MHVGIKWGVILGVAVVVWTLVVHFLGFYTTNLAAGQRADSAAAILPIATILLALRERKKISGRLTLQEALGTAMVVGITSVPITASFLWVYHNYMNPRWVDYLVEYQRAKMAAVGASAEEMATAEAQQRASATDSAQLWGAVIGSLVVSAVLGFIGWTIFRKRMSEDT
jgi:hypothetical protein